MGLFDDTISSIKNSFSWENLKTGALVAGTAYDIYQGYKDSSAASDANADASSLYNKQAEWLGLQIDRYKDVYWPYEDLQYQYAIEDLLSTRDENIAMRDYWEQRTLEQIDQAKSLNPILDENEKSLIRKLVEGEDVLADRYRSQATADVQAAFGSQREQDMRAMGLAGINPNSGQMQNYINRMGAAQALSEAGTRTNATRLAEDTALQRQATAMDYSKSAMSPTHSLSQISGAGLSYAGLGGAYGTMAGTLSKNAQNSWNGANTLLNVLSDGKYGNLKSAGTLGGER